MAQFRPADHSKGDANTIGGYLAVHDRPAAFEGSDGFSYSVEIVADETQTGAPDAVYAAYLLFVRWARVGAQAPTGHLETEYLATGATAEEARRTVGAMPLSAVKRTLDALIRERSGAGPPRRWWDAMRDEGSDA